jgi:hypothetical protein
MLGWEVQPCPPSVPSLTVAAVPWREIFLSSKVLRFTREFHYEMTVWLVAGGIVKTSV